MTDTNTPPSSNVTRDRIVNLGTAIVVVSLAVAVGWILIAIARAVASGIG